MKQLNFQKIVLDLVATGLTQQALADLVPCHQSTIASYINGTRGIRPSYEIACRLQNLHSQMCKKSLRARPHN